MGGNMTPYLEVIRITPTESFTVSAHGYPFHTVRWHFHPEYEIHLVTETSGHYFVGDHIGEFRPNNLIMTGPNLPHNWVSDVPVGVTIPRRCAFLQFNQNFIESCLRTFPELGDFKVLLEESRRGIFFSALLRRNCAPSHDRTDHRNRCSTRFPVFASHGGADA